jgi:hypothetical protein
MRLLSEDNLQQLHKKPEAEKGRATLHLQELLEYYTIKITL